MDELMEIEGAKLRRAHLDDLPDGVLRPLYKVEDLTPGIVHIGVGNFHRAHQAWYLHRLMQQGLALDWAVVGAGVRSNDAVMRDRLLDQDCLTTLIELQPAGTSVEVCGAMIDFLAVEPDNAQLIAKMSAPEIRIVSLTVTEGGYFLNPATGQFDPEHPDILHDAAHPTAPRTAFGAIVASLRQRRDAGTGPFTIQSCDNLQANGDVAHATVVSLARLSDPALADWIAETCTFPNSMVDCIVPATGPTEIATARALGIDDNAPVTHENFRQWVIEDAFCAGRPDWDQVGATFTSDVHAYETMKIRILNAGHQMLANAGELLGIESIAQCMTHPLIAPFWRKVEQEEVVPHVPDVPGMRAADYVSLIERRFANSAVRDTPRRVAFDGSSRHTGFVLPILRDALETGTSIEGLALVEALWARMCAGIREDGSIIAPNDPNWQSLQSTAQVARENPEIWRAQQTIYGELSRETRFADAFDRWLRLIWSKGTSAALKAYVELD